MEIKENPILKIAIPSIVSNITVPLLGLVDMAITGHLGNSAYIGAISLGGMLFNLCYWLFTFLRMGTGGLTSQAFGAGNNREITLILARTQALSLLVSFLLIAFHEKLLQVAFNYISSSPEVESLSATYFRILIWGAPAVLCLYSFTGWFLGMQDARVPMVIAIVQNIVNIAASLFFVTVLHWKIEGVAIGSLVAQYSGLVMAICFWKRKYWKNAAKISLGEVCEGKALKKLFNVNRDIFLRTLCIICVTTFFTSAGARQGNSILAANAILMQFFFMFSYVMDGFAYAGEALSGRYMGACDSNSFRDNSKKLFCWGLWLSTFATVLYALMARPFLHALTDEAGIIETAQSYLFYVVCIPYASFAAFLLDGIFIGTTSTKQMLVGMSVAAAMFFAVYFLLENLLGNHALWIAFLSYLFFRGLVQSLFYGKIAAKVKRPQSQS